jgi:NTP pyrophosphatase (non-canonical NTP hydrolase)
VNKLELVSEYLNFTLNEYQKMTRRTESKEQNEVEKILNYSMGIAGEAGEIVDAVKKAVFHKHGLTPAFKRKLALELGDELWYIARLADVLGYTLEDIATMNIGKLKERYPNGFEANKSINRKEEE